MHVALVQMIATMDPRENLAVVDAALDPLSAADGVDLVVLPEASMVDFGPDGYDLSTVAEPLDGPFVTALAKHAERLATTVIAGMFERSEEPPGVVEPREGALPYNTVVVVGPDGETVASYRKIHLFDSFGHRESDQLSAGDITTTVIPVADRRIGVMTCYDLRFPEYARMLVDAGADVLCVPAAWVRGPLKEGQWSTLLQARAIENTVDVLGVGQCGPLYVGGTAAVDAAGVVVAAAGEQPQVVRAELTAARLTQVRAINPSLANRRIGAPR